MIQVLLCAWFKIVDFAIGVHLALTLLGPDGPTEIQMRCARASICSEPTAERRGSIGQKSWHYFSSLKDGFPLNPT